MDTSDSMVRPTSDLEEGRTLPTNIYGWPIDFTSGGYRWATEQEDDITMAVILIGLGMVLFYIPASTMVDYYLDGDPFMIYLLGILSGILGILTTLALTQGI